MSEEIDAQCPQHGCAHRQCANCPTELQSSRERRDYLLQPISEPHRSPPSNSGAAHWGEAQRHEAQNEPAGYAIHPSTSLSLGEINRDSNPTGYDGFDPFIVGDSLVTPDVYCPEAGGGSHDVFLAALWDAAYESNDPGAQHHSGDDDEPGNASASDTEPTFACPFLKYDPDKHAGCSHFKLSRIRDVKQHIKRKHESEQSKGQKAALKTKSDPKQDFRRQWYAIWNILFPGKQDPSSPYVDSCRSEELNSLLRFWETGARVQTMRDVLTRRGYPHREADRIADVLSCDFFELILQRWYAVRGADASRGWARRGGSTGCVVRGSSLAVAALDDAAGPLELEADNLIENVPVDEIEYLPGTGYSNQGGFEVDGFFGDEFLFVDPADLARGGL
ncbi:hypothetical protein OQA88_1245 [Cercophora sp. LCS_1]